MADAVVTEILGLEVQRLRQVLWDIYRAAGADPDGYAEAPVPGVMTPDVPELALEAVRELRKARWAMSDGGALDWRQPWVSARAGEIGGQTPDLACRDGMERDDPPHTWCWRVSGHEPPHRDAVGREWDGADGKIQVSSEPRKEVGGECL